MPARGREWLFTQQVDEGTSNQSDHKLLPRRPLQGYSAALTTRDSLYGRRNCTDIDKRPHVSLNGNKIYSYVEDSFYSMVDGYILHKRSYAIIRDVSKVQ